MKSINPATGQLVAEYVHHSASEVETILTANRSAQRCWRGHRLDERAAVLLKTAEAMESRTVELAGLITLEMGKPRGEALAEIKRCINVCRFYAARAESILAPRVPEGAPEGASIIHEPLGPVLAIMPWNFPFWQVMRCAAPVLMGGNSFLLKHAPSVTGCALAIEEIVSRAGGPEGLFRALIIDECEVAGVIADRRVRAVSLTGSCRAGAAVAEAAGRSLKKAVLELGGSDPFIVLRDADVSLAVHTAVAARFYNAGQTCVSAKRFLVDRKVSDEFEERMAKAVSLLKLGDPAKPETRIGPMARQDLRENLERQVRESVSMGARMIHEGGPLDCPGFYYSPVVLAGVRQGMPVFEEEVFGPVASISTFADPEEALRMANATRYGLGASVWTRDERMGRKLAGLIECGTVALNTLVKSDPTLPFGGTKDSGFGRELGDHGMLEFANLKVLRVPPSS